MKEIDKEKYVAAEFEPSKLSQIDEYLTENHFKKDKRYAIIDKESGEIIDDAQGYGYKSMQNAYKAFYCKLNKNKFKSDKKNCEKWWKHNQDFHDRIEEEYFWCIKENCEVKIDDIEKIANDMNIDLPCNVKTLMKYF